MKNTENVDVLALFTQYPPLIRKKLLILRQLILDTAAETDGVEELEETLKWGEPSYLTKTGSTIRVGAVKSNPNQYALYFHCKTNLIDTFKELYKDQFTFVGNRAILFNTTDDSHFENSALNALKLTYHKIKHLPMLGV